MPSTIDTPLRTLVDAQTKVKPLTVDLLLDWQYLERSIHRILCAWGRHVPGWEDKSALHRQVWEQADLVRRMRQRIGEFPGGKPDNPVSSALEELANSVLLAPTVEDVLDGVHLLLGRALVNAYVDYSSRTHPVHDAPTLALLHEVNHIKAGQWLWYREYRRRRPHSVNASYLAQFEACLAALNGLTVPQPRTATSARPAGVGTTFRPGKISLRDVPSRPQHDFMPFVRADFTTSLEARRLFWAYAYMSEKNLPDDQLLWIYDGHFMPWEWHMDVSRHLWDESRHGDSGHSRLRDFGIRLEEIGFHSYAPDLEAELQRLAQEDGRDLDCAERLAELSTLTAPEMTPHDLYEAVFFIGLIAENGHFIVKNEAYRDFQAGKDMESAEMMLFDIIDETTHVQYAHQWLPILAEHAGISHEGYRERAVKVRREHETKESTLVAELQLDRSPDNSAYAFYQELLERIRNIAPLDNANTCPARSPKPM